MALTLSPVAAAPVGTAFTYQGRLNDNGAAPMGIFDIRFAIYDSLSGGNVAGGPVTNAATGVTNGLFAVTLDFGAVFDGSARWLEIGVRTNGGGAFTTLAPRQALTPTPYAIMAGSASNVLGLVPASQLSGTLAAGQMPATVVTNNSSNLTLSGAFTGNGAGVSNVNAAALGGLDATNFWQLGGNKVAAGQFLGSTNSQAVEFRVNNVRALRLEPRANDANFSNLVNVVAGFPGNSIAADAYGSVIAGGGADNYYGYTGSNSIASDLCFVGGGLGNQIGIYAYNSFLGGGESNVITTDSCYSFLGGGDNNAIGEYAINAFLGGGEFNQIGARSHYSFLGGGENNTVQQAYAVVLGGGTGNTIQTDSGYAFLGGGRDNTIQTNVSYSFLGGGEGNIIQPKAWHAVLVGGAGNTLGTNASYSFIGAGSMNAVEPLESFLGGGYDNAILTNADYSFLGGGEYNRIHTNAFAAFLGGGMFNSIRPYATRSVLVGGAVNVILTNASYSFLGGGLYNTNGAPYSVVPGGDLNHAGGTNSFAAGHRAKANYAGDFVWADSQNADFNSSANDQFLIRAQGGVGINTNNPQSALHVNGVIIASGFAGSGAGLTSLNAAQLAGSAGNFSATNITVRGSLTGNGASVTNVNAAALNGLNASNFWQLGGNNVAAGQFLGSTNNEALEIRVQGKRALRIQPTTNDSPNLIGGAAINGVFPGYVGSVIAGGGTDVPGQFYSNRIAASYAVIGGGYGNLVYGSNSVIAGGAMNQIDVGSVQAVVGGGIGNLIGTTSGYPVIGGGRANTIAGSTMWPTIGGGSQNFIGSGGVCATIAGGESNQINSGSPGSTIGGGMYNTIQNNSSFAVIPGGEGNVAAGYGFAAGSYAQAIHAGSFVWADFPGSGVPFASTTSNQFNIRAHGGARFETVGAGMTLDGQPVVTAATIIGANQLSGTYTNGLAFNNAANAFSGSGSGLTALNASQLTSGTLPPARLPAAVVTNTAGGLTLSGTFSGSLSGAATGSLLMATNLPVSMLNLSSVAAGTWTKVGNVGTFTKQSGATTEVTYNGRLMVGGWGSGATGADFELRVDDTAVTFGRARATVAVTDSTVNGVPVSMTGIFNGLAAGSHTVSIWIYSYYGTASAVQVNPGGFSAAHVVAKEYK